MDLWPELNIAVLLSPSAHMLVVASREASEDLTNAEPQKQSSPLISVVVGMPRWHLNKKTMLAGHG